MLNSLVLFDEKYFLPSKAAIFVLLCKARLDRLARLARRVIFLVTFKGLVFFNAGWVSVVRKCTRAFYSKFTAKTGKK